MTNIDTVFVYGERKFLVDYTSHFGLKQLEGKAFLKDTDTRVKLVIPMTALKGLKEFYQQYFPEILIGY